MDLKEIKNHQVWIESYNANNPFHKIFYLKSDPTEYKIKGTALDHKSLIREYRSETWYMYKNVLLTSFLIYFASSHCIHLYQNSMGENIRQINNLNV